MRHIKFGSRIRGFVISILLLLGLIPIAANAQGFIVDWSNPEVLFSTPEGQKSNELWVLRDKADNLYLWWPIFDAATEEEPINQSIDRTLHTQQVNGEWRSPMDVMVWADAGRLTTVAIDLEGLLHAFSATDTRRGRPRAVRHSVQHWSTDHSHRDVLFPGWSLREQRLGARRLPCDD